MLRHVIFVLFLLGITGCADAPSASDKPPAKAMRPPQGLPGGPPGDPKIPLQNDEGG